MSDWAWKLCGKWSSEHGKYGLPRDVSAAFKANREAAIHHLLIITDGRQRFINTWRERLAKHLPKEIARQIEPELPKCRWAGVLALSTMARGAPDERIARAFAAFIQDGDPKVRKVAAYEMGLWINPDHPEALVQAFFRALKDEHPDVRRDACRRIAESATAEPLDYVRQLLGLRDQLELLTKNDAHEIVRVNAAKAHCLLKQSELRLNRSAGPAKN